MNKNEAMAKFADILQIIEMWATEDVNNDTVMSGDEFEVTVSENEYDNLMATILVTIREYYQYLTGASDE